MSKKNGKKRNGERGASSNSSEDSSASSSSSAPAEPRRRLTIPERFVAKSQHIHERVKDLLEMSTYYGAPQDVIASVQNLLVEADAARGKIQELIAGGWEPAVKADLKELAEGDKISITDESKSLYEYIPAGTNLAVGKIERSANNRIRRVLLIDERVFGEGVPEGVTSAFGWAQLSHIERR